jgi:hypothetical protein
MASSDDTDKGEATVGLLIALNNLAGGIGPDLAVGSVKLHQKINKNK